MKGWLLEKQWRVVLGGILLVAVPILGLALFVYFTMAQSLEALLVQTCRDNVADCVYAVTAKLDGDITTGRLFASRLLLHGEILKKDQPGLTSHLKTLLTISSSLERAVITSPQGVLLADYPPDPELLGRNFSSRDWYRGVSRQWTPYVSDYYQRRAAPRNLVFSLAIPIKSQDNHILGILVMQPKADYFQVALGRTEKKRVAITIIDRDGRVIYFSGPKREQSEDISSYPLIRKLRQGLSGEEKITALHGWKTVIAAYRPAPWGWGVIAESSIKEAMAPFTSATLSLTIFSAVMLLLGGFGAYRGIDLILSVQRLGRELQQANDAMQVHQHQLAESNDRLTVASKTKSDFLANMSHELRTPLNSIIGFSEVLRDELFGPLNPKQKEYVEYIDSSGGHLLRLINDILDLAKVESGKMELELTAFVLKETLNLSLTMLREKALQHGINLGLEVEPEAEGEVVLDERKFKQIMYNLLSNAVKFTPSGGRVTVSVRRLPPAQSPIPPGTTAKTGWLEICVADTGIGIQPEDLGRIFQEFTQLSPVYTKTHEGTGLGLALTKRLVELHGGRIWVESEPGLGSRFYFTIPQKASDSPAPVFAAPAVSPWSERNERVVLVIDDAPQTLMILKNSLQSEDVRVVKAEGGPKGLEEARRIRPDLIILDLLMPEMNGFEVLEALKSKEETAAIPVIVFTAMDLSAENKARLREKAKAIVEKGVVSQDAFVEQVQQVLRGQFLVAE